MINFIGEYRAKVDDKGRLVFPSAFKAVCGEQIKQGDAGYIFHAFDCMPVMMLFWDGDDEFPAQANMLFDTGITDFTHVETVCAVAGDLMRRLRELAGLA